ncbi:MAG: energy-coupling factor transporter transmembrane protein EcfT [Eubacteriaceae bacterium]|jgi:cobalt/nickel transport system permease protein|nr:energy-coupling factor transporter transmembrane protein EcfT [Eubacteriaceae bacterium]
MEKTIARPDRTAMPEWLMDEDEYVPQSGGDTFINKSILAVLGVISRVRNQSMTEDSANSAGAAVKLLGTLLTVLYIAVTKQPSFLKFVLVYELIVLCLMKPEIIKKILKVSAAAASLTFIVMLPALLWGNTYSCLTITSKVFLTITAVNMMSFTTKWNGITSALKKVHCPDMFIFVLDITIKYIVMLGDLVLNMLYALRLRSVGRDRSKYGSLAGVAGTAYIKSQEMAVEMYHAMECRGFDGEYKAVVRSRFTKGDAFSLLIYAGLTALFVFYAMM